MPRRVAVLTWRLVCARHGLCIPSGRRPQTRGHSRGSGHEACAGDTGWSARKATDSDRCPPKLCRRWGSLPCLVLEEGAAVLGGAGEVVGGGAAQPEAAQRSPRALAAAAGEQHGAAAGRRHVHQGPVDRLIHLLGPQGAVQMHPHVHVQVQQPGREDPRCSRVKRSRGQERGTFPQGAAKELGTNICPKAFVFPLCLGSCCVSLVFCYFFR